MSVYDNLRPVMIHEHYLTWRNDEAFPEQPGLFHCWAGTSERAYALIELHNGHIMDVKQEEFHFTDKFQNSAWLRTAYQFVDRKEDE